MQWADSLLVCPQSGRENQITLSHKTFSNQSKLAEKPKRNPKTLLDKGIEFPSKVNFQKQPHPSAMKWECSSCWSPNIPRFCGWTPGSQTYHWDSTEKSRPKPRYHKLLQESLESIKNKNKISKSAAQAFLSITSKPIVNHIVLVII